MPWPPPPTHLLALVLLTVLVACHGGGSSSTSSTGRAMTPPSITTTTVARPSTTADPQAADKAAIRKVAEGWFRAVVRIGGRPNVSDAAYSRYLTPKLAAEYRAKFAERLRVGLVTRPAASPHDFYRVRVASLRSDTASLVECEVDDRVLVNARLNEVVSDQVVSVEVYSTAVRIGGEWRLDSQRVSNKTPGVSGCVTQ